jgi:hypothetical protein
MQDLGAEVGLQLRVNRLACGVDHEDVLPPGSRVHRHAAVKLMVAALEKAGQICGPMQDICDVGDGCGMGKEGVALSAVVTHFHQAGGEVVVGAYGVHGEVLAAAAGLASRGARVGWAWKGEVFWLSRHDEPWRVRESGYLWHKY